MSNCHQAGDQITTGSNIETICGFDYETGKPLVVRLKGTPVPPEGWESACQPKKKDGYNPNFYYTIGEKGHYPRSGLHTYHYTWDGKSRHFITVGEEINPIVYTKYDTLPELLSAISSIYTPYMNHRCWLSQSVETFPVNKIKEMIEKLQQDFSQSWASSRYMHTGCILKLTTQTGSNDHSDHDAVYIGFYANKKRCTDCPQEKYEGWPTDRPPEIIYDPVTRQFKNPCPGVMPLPPEYNQGKSCVLLCDRDGNKVLLRITDHGITIAQQKYGQTTVVDPESGKVKTSQNSTAFIELTSETVFELPTPRSRTTIGVGESVKITANTAVTWKINGVAVDKGTEASTEINFTAQDIAGSVTITAKNECDSESIPFSVIEPQYLDYVQGSYYYLGESTPRMMIYHQKGTLELVVGLRITVYPSSVNFANIILRELDAASIDTGVFKGNTIRCHLDSPPQNGQCLGTGKKMPIGVESGVHNRVINNVFDMVGGGENDPAKIPTPLPPENSMIIDIPIQWSLNGQQNWKKLAHNSYQKTIATSNYDITTSKGSFSRAVNINDSMNDRYWIDHNPTLGPW